MSSERPDQLSDDALKLLRCPKTGGALERGERDGSPVLICRDAKLVYPIEDGLPVLVPTAAIKLNSGD